MHIKLVSERLAMLGAQTAKKLKIGVFMGGLSIEREVSFNSGRTICDHLDTDKYEINPIFQAENGTLYLLPWHFLHRGKIADFRHRLDSEAKKIAWDDLKTLVDFVYIAVHGRYAEDGTLQGMFDVLGIPYLGTKVFGSAIGMDKVVQKELLKTHNIGTARGIAISYTELNKLTQEEIVARLEAQNVRVPVIVKPSHEGSSLGISCAHINEELLPAILKAAHADHRKTQDVIIEEKIEGMEFVCVLLQKVSNINGKITKEWMTLPLTQVIPEKNFDIFDYEQKYMPGRATKITPAPCSAEDTQRIIDSCIKASDLFDFSTISRIDGFLAKDGRVLLTDPNTLTGMSPATFLFHQAAEVGMSHTKLINFLIENELVHYGLSPMASHQTKEEECVMTNGKKKIRIAVLLGGESNEREISLDSGRNICYKLSPQKYDVIPVFVNDKMELYKLSQKLLIKNSTREIAAMVTKENQINWHDLPTISDFVFLGLHGGKGENGAVQGTIEMLGLPYNGSGVLASALCMDKFRTNNFLRSQGFEVPQSILLSHDEWIGMAEEQKENFCNTISTSSGEVQEGTACNNNLSYPVILKPHDDGCSVMVQKAKSPEDMRSKIDVYFTSNKQFVLIEELILGTELTCGVMGNDTITALPPSQVVASKGILSIEEKFLPGEGENQTPANIPGKAIELVQAVVKKAFITVGCKGYARIDCFYQTAEQSTTGKERVILLEFNTLPGMTAATCIFHQAAEIGLKPMDFIDTIIELGLELHAQMPAKDQITNVAQNNNQDIEPIMAHQVTQTPKTSKRQRASKDGSHAASQEKIDEQLGDDPAIEEARRFTLKIF